MLPSPSSINKYELDNQELILHVKYLNEQLKIIKAVNDQNKIVISTFLKEKENTVLNLMSDISEKEELSQLRSENIRLQEQNENMISEHNKVLNEYVGRIEKLSADIDKLSKKKSNKKEVNIKQFVSMLEELPDRARKDKVKQAPQFIANLQSMWERIPDDKKTDELKKLWYKKFCKWDDVYSSEVTIRKKRSDNEHFHTCDEIISQLEENMQNGRRRRIN